MRANLNMINLSLDKLKLVVKNRDIKNYENKFEEDLIKILSKPKPDIGISKKKIKEIKKYFDELRYRFSISEIKKFRKSFYDIKNHRNISTSEIRETEKNLIELEKSLKFKKNRIYSDEYKKRKSLRRLFKYSSRDYYKPTKIVDNFDKKKNYTE